MYRLHTGALHWVNAQIDQMDCNPICFIFPNSLNPPAVLNENLISIIYANTFLSTFAQMCTVPKRGIFFKKICWNSAQGIINMFWSVSPTVSGKKNMTQALQGYKEKNKLDFFLFEFRQNRKIGILTWIISDNFCLITFSVGWLPWKMTCTDLRTYA